MDTSKTFIVIACLLAGSCIATGIISYNIYVSSKEIAQTNMRSIHTLQQDIRQIEAGLAAIKDRMADTYNMSSDPQRNLGYQAKNKAGINGSNSLTTLNHEELLRLKKIIKSTGLDKLASMENIDPTVLLDLYDKHAEKENIKSYHQDLLQRNAEQHSYDRERYDEELNRLYNLARFRMGTAANSEEREKAFNEMLSKYPDSYATAMVVADRALMSAFRRDHEKVENYYDILIKSGNQDVAYVVTDRGMEALPNIEHYLARHYISTGRPLDADQMIESLERNYTDSMLFVRKAGIGPSLQPVTKVIEELRKLNNQN